MKRKRKGRERKRERETERNETKGRVHTDYRRARLEKHEELILGNRRKTDVDQSSFWR